MASDLRNCIFHFVKYKGKYVRTSVLPFVPSLLVGNDVIVTSILQGIIFTSTTTTVSDSSFLTASLQLDSLTNSFIIKTRIIVNVLKTFLILKSYM